MNIHNYLRSINLSGETQHSQLDTRLMKSLDQEGQKKLQNAWNILQLNGNPSELYTVPQNLKQASLLFSHDYQRIAASSKWISKTFEYLGTDSLVDVGCGYGILLGYLNKKFSQKRLMGIDLKKNLVQIGRELTGIDLIEGDYSKITPLDTYETIVCDFGFDLSDLEVPNRSHNTSEIGGIVYCPNCCSDFKSKLSPIMTNWRNWGVENASLIMTGRLTVNSSYLLATLQMAHELNWNLNLEMSTCLKIHNKRTKRSEKFPGLLFKTSFEDQVNDNFIEISKMLEIGQTT